MSSFRQRLSNKLKLYRDKIRAFYRIHLRKENFVAVLRRVGFILGLAYSDRKARYILLFLIFIFVSGFTIYNIEQHYTFKTYAFDLGIYMQALYTTAFHGMFLYETPDIYHVSSGSFFGVHFTPLTLVLVPIYRLFPHAITLFLIQNIVAGLAIWFLYKLSLAKTQSVIFSLIIAISFMLNPFVHMALMFPFHIEIFCPLFIFMSLYYFETSQFKKSVASIILLMLTIDFAIIIASVVVLYLAIKSRSSRIRRSFITLFIVSLIFLYIATRTISLFGPEPLSFGGLFGILGSSWKEILINALTRPDLVVRSIWYNLILKMVIIFLLVLPYISVVFYAPPSSWLLLAPLSFILLSTRYSMVVPGWHIHGSFFLPLVIGATLDGFQSLNKTSLRILMKRKYVDTLLLIIIMFALTSPLTLDTAYIDNNRMALGTSYISKPEYSPKVTFIHEVLKHIDPSSSILVQNHLFPHLANRINAYVWIPPGTMVEFALADIEHHDYYTKHGDVSFNQQFEKLIDQGYKICVYGYGVMLLAKDKCPLEMFTPLHLVYTYRNITAGSFETIEFSGDRVLKYKGDSGSFIYGPYISLPPGTYSVKYDIFLLDTQCEGIIGVIDVVSDFGTNRLAYRPIYCHELRESVFNTFQLNFSVNNVARNVEFRFVDLSNRFADKLLLRKIEIEMVSKQPVEIFEKFLYSANLIPKGSRIFNGLLVHTPEDDRGVLWFVPYIPLKRGTYIAVLSIKIDVQDIVTGTVLQIDVVASKGTRQIAVYNITSYEFYDNEWTSITFTFDVLEDLSDIEIRGIGVSEGVSVYLAYIKLQMVG